EALLQRRSPDGAGGRRKADEGRVLDAHVAVEGIRDHAGKGGDADRRERRGRGVPRIPSADQEEQRHDDDSASDPEQRTEDACDSGRAGDDARRVVGVPELAYVGNHGLELDPEADAWRERLARFLAETAWPRTEDKGLSAALHYREVEDEAAARAALDQIAANARAQGFVARYGRKVLEVLPPLEANKGTAVRRLLADRAIELALYAGDDTTDLDAFRALEGLELGVRVAVA